MADKKNTIKDCNEEIIRLARILVCYKYDEEDDKNIKKLILEVLKKRGQLEKEKMLAEEKKRADREARKYGIRR